MLGSMMNRLLPWCALALSALALGASFRGRGDAREDAPAPSELRDPAPRADADELERRVADLEATAQSLSRRLMALERRGTEGGAAPAAVGGEAPAALAQQVQQLRAEVQGLVVGEAMHTPEGRAQLKEVVRSVQEELVADRVSARQSARAEARKERLARFVTEARLTASQERDLTALLETEEQRRQALIEAMRRDQRPPRDARQALRALREETDAAATRLLDEQQRGLYQELRREEGQGGRGGGRPRPGSSPGESR